MGFIGFHIRGLNNQNGPGSHSQLMDFAGSNFLRLGILRMLGFRAGGFGSF